MKLLLKFFIILSVISSGFTLAQDNSSINTDVKVVLTRSLSLQTSRGLYINDMLLSNIDFEKSINNSDGMKFSITGQSNRIVIVSYDQFITLVRVPMLKEMSLKSGAESDNKDLPVITFKTNTAEETGTTGHYLNPKPFLSGLGLPLAENHNTGKLTFWIGGSLILPKMLKEGQYLGKFEVTSIY